MKRYSDFLVDDGFVIFLFHGVIRKQRHLIRNYTRKHIPLDYFETVLWDLCAHGTPISMQDVAAGVKLPGRAFAVTFDDGFENNYSVAAPLLEQLPVPATFYVTTGFIGHDRLSWIDMIEYAFEQRDTVSVRLPDNNKDICGTTPEEKKSILDTLRQEIKKRHDIDPYDFAKNTCRRLEVDVFDPDPDLDRKMTWDQVSQLARHPLFIVGGARPYPPGSLHAAS